MCLSLLPAAVLAAEPTTTATGTALTDASRELSDGTYYLSGDTVLTGTIQITGEVTLDLNGNVLMLNSSTYGSAAGGSVIEVADGGHLTLTDSNPSAEHYFYAKTGSVLWRWDAEAEGNASQPSDTDDRTYMTLTGGVITGGAGSHGGGIHVLGGANASDSALTMNGGSIIGCTSLCGGGVFVGSLNSEKCGTFAMNGGSIMGCAASQQGGGVFVNPGSSFTLTNGTLRECVSKQYDNGAMCSGGGVYNGGTFTMEGSKIKDCKILPDSDKTLGNALGAGAGGVSSNGSFTLSGGEISGRAAVDSKGDGIFLREKTLADVVATGYTLKSDNSAVDLSQNSCGNVKVVDPNFKESVSYLDYVNGQAATKTCDNYTEVTADTTTLSGWCVVSEDVTISGKLSASQDVHLILCDNATLTVGGIAVSGSYNATTADLSIYAQSTGANMGKLCTTGGIETENNINTTSYGISVTYGDLTINGGDITAIGATITQVNNGIGCGISVTYGDATVNNGKITATGGAAKGTTAGYSYGFTVRGMSGMGNLTVNGGTIVATADAAEGGFATSNGIYTTEMNAITPTGGKLTVNSGSVTAKAGNAKNGEVTLSADGVRVTALSVTGGTLTAKSGTVTPTGNKVGSDADILFYGTTIGGTMTVSGGKVQSENGAAVVVNNLGSGVVSISGGTCKLAKDSAIYSLQTSNDVTLLSLLDTGCAYQSGEERVALGDKTSLSNVTVVTCGTHSYESGKCVYCGGAQPTGGGGSRSSTTTTTTKNPDGSTTVTKTDQKMGTVTTTVITTSGTTVTTVTDKSGNATTSVSLSEQDTKNGAATLPVDEVNTENPSEISVEIPKNSSVTVEIPVENVTPGTVVVIVDENGNETVVATTGLTENGVTVTLTENCTIKVIENAKAFEDVPENSYYEDAVAWASAREITGGVGENNFGAENDCGRAQFVTFLWRAAGQPEAEGDHTFSDVDNDAYYTDAVKWAASLGIVSGYDTGLFGTDDTITREQMAVILYRFAQKTGLDTTQGGMAVREFSDSEDISDYAVAAMQWAVNAGVMQGYDGNLMPGAECTRAQIVTMLYRLLGK